MQAYIERVLEHIDKAGDDKKMWVLRLSLISHLPLSPEEISELAMLRGYPESKVRSCVAAMIQQVEVKEKMRIETLGKTVILWHEIRRLEARLIDGGRSYSNAAETESIIFAIREKMEQREKLLRDGKKLSRPANRDIAVLIGLPEDQAEQVTTLLIRARNSLRTKMERLVSPDEM